MRGLLALILIAACADEPAGRLELPVIGGTLDEGDPAVVEIIYFGPDGGWGCSGALIAPTVVLTAAHCVQEAVDVGLADYGEVLFGTYDESPDQVIGIADARYHPRYDPSDVGVYDVGLIRLEQASDVTPLPINARALEGVIDGGDHVRTVGFGLNDAEQHTGFGTKRSARLPVQWIALRHMIVGNDSLRTCSGDSGGPSLYTFDGVEAIVGVTSFGRVGCAGTHGTLMRVDPFVDDFLLPVMTAWDGPCAADDACVSAGCPSPDPDCDPCGLQGVCQTGCAVADLDCPLDRGYLAFCADDTDCASRICVAADEDPDVGYCTERCTAGDAFFYCGGGMSCRTIDGEDLCVYATSPTPGVTGAACSTPGECASGLCDLAEGRCTKPCATDDVCPDGYACDDGAGTCRPDESSGCRVAPGAAAPGPALLLVLALLGAIARHQRGPRP
jgi:MYXO-CTERM domain-containing protein